MEAINAWLEHWEPTWLFLILLIETIVSTAILVWTIKEFYYDYSKDANKRTRKKKGSLVVDSVERGVSGDKREGEDTGGAETEGC